MSEFEKAMRKAAHAVRPSYEQAFMRGAKAALDSQLVRDMAEAIRNFKLQTETHGGDYLPGNAKQLNEALAAYDLAKAGGAG